MSVRADVLRGAGGFPSDLGRRKLGFSVSGRARIGGKAESCEETEFSIRAARLFPGGYWAYRPGARMHHAVPTQRTTWKYFVHRCPVEGTAKAVLTCLAGSKDGLGAEGRYVREVLPRAVVNDLGAALRGQTGATRRAGAIIAGLRPYGVRLRQNPPQRGRRSSLQVSVLTGPRLGSIAVVDGAGHSSKLRALLPAGLGSVAMHE